MDLLTQLHAIAGLVLLAFAAAVALGAWALVGLRPAPELVDRLRRIALGLLVAQAAIGIALVVRGHQPGEWLHWLYGVAIVVTLLYAGTVAADRPPQAQTTILAAAFTLSAIFAWRLWGSG